LIFTAILLLALVILGFAEYRSHQKMVRNIPHRIHVNGTRGKSSVTRLVTGGLQRGGLRTMGKSTGTRPCYIDPDGTERVIFRVGKANILEQLKVVRRAVMAKVDALVVECMAVLPQNQFMAERQIIHSTVGVITNARADHLDEMGPTVADVARSLANTIPYNGVCFTSEQQHFHVLEAVARERQTTIHCITPERITADMTRGFGYLEHRDNIALALAVCRHFGIAETDALAGMQSVVPDPGVLRVYRIHYFDKEVEFVNAFAANDPDSYTVIWDMLAPYFTPEKKVIVIVNCRKDRIQRSESMADLIVNRIHADHFILVGEFTTALENRVLSLGFPRQKISNLIGQSVEEVFQSVAGMTPKASIVLGIGNIVGYGEELVQNFSNKGTEHAYRSS
jgi:poly-gamma-glutamate synthase PgsB/CapB